MNEGRRKVSWKTKVSEGGNRIYKTKGMRPPPTNTPCYSPNCQSNGQGTHPLI